MTLAPYLGSLYGEVLLIECLCPMHILLQLSSDCRLLAYHSLSCMHQVYSPYHVHSGKSCHPVYVCHVSQRQRNKVYPEAPYLWPSLLYLQIFCNSHWQVLSIHLQWEVINMTLLI